LFRDHHGELVRLALLMVGDRPTAEDVVHDAYASAHARWHRLAAREAALPYVRAAVLNGCRSVLRRRGIARRAGVLHRVSVRDEARRRVPRASDPLRGPPPGAGRAGPAAAPPPGGARAPLLPRPVRGGNRGGPGISAGWIEPGALIPLPARLGVDATPIAW
jgi:hypothetical protein